MKKIIQITAGRGPLECMYVVSKVLKDFLKHVKAEGLDFNTIQRNTGPKPETINSIILSLEGKNIDKFMKAWQGSVLWIGKSPYRKFHKRKNWFIEINVFDNIQKTEFNKSEIEFKTTKSSGPGGQHVNKTDSAVWATHKESGIKVFVQDTRSQFQNKKLAIERLQEAINKDGIKQMQNQNFEHWKKTTDILRGNPIRTYEGIKFKQVRIK